MLVTAIGKHSAIQYEEIKRITYAQEATYYKIFIAKFLSFKNHNIYTSDRSKANNIAYTEGIRII